MVAKYPSGRPVLVRVGLRQLPERLRAGAAGRAPIEQRAMVEARLDTGERLMALNDVSSAVAATSRRARGPEFGRADRRHGHDDPRPRRMRFAWSWGEAGRGRISAVVHRGRDVR